MLPLIQQEPLWTTKTMYRLGTHYRANEDRFIYVATVGWFIRLRGEFNLVSGLHSSSNTAGPFSTRAGANRYLQEMIGCTFKNSA